MSDALQPAIVAIQTGNLEQARRLLMEILQTDPANDQAWVLLSQAVTDDERRRASLDRALMLNPDNREAQQALLEWLTIPEVTAIATPSTPPSARAPAKPAQPTTEVKPAPGMSLKEFLLQLQKNYNILKEREAKYGTTAAPLSLLNQIDDYEQAIELTEEAIARVAPLEELQAEFNNLNLEISTVVIVAQSEPPRKPFHGQNPYRGLRKFTEEDAKFFYGRNAAIQSLLDTIDYLVEAETSQQAPDLVSVLGPSGSGKSSLVRAGLIPALRDGRIEGSHRWPIKVMLPGAHPLEALAEAFMGDVGRDLASIRQSLAGGERALHDLMVEALAAASKPDDVIFTLVIDQFEELFTICESEAERRAFIDQLLHATQVQRNRSMVVLTMRSDFYSQLATYKPLAEAVTRYQMLISPMTEKELREAILLPAEAVGLELEKALVETLLKDTFDAPGVLPLLQHALLELFNRRDGNLLTLDAYNEIGGVKGALAHRADGVINDLKAGQQRIARRIFMRLIRLGEGAADTRRRATFDEVVTQESQREPVQEVIKILADANLIITSRNPETDEIILDVSHEALIREWPLLRHWLNEDRVGLRIRQQLSQAVQEWEERNRDADSLYRGARLLEIEEWVAANPDEINPLEQAFLEASLEARERAAAEREAQRQRELEAARKLAAEAEARREAEAKQAREAEARAKEQTQAASRLRRRAFWLAGVLGVAVLLGIAAIVFAVSATESATEARLAQETAVAERDRAEQNANLAATREAEAVSAEATSVAERDRAESNANLAATREAEAVAAQATAVAERDRAEQQAALARAEQTAAQARTLVDNQYDTALLFSLEANRILADVQLPGTVETRGSVLATVNQYPHLIRYLHGHSDSVNSLALSPDNQILASAGWDNKVIVWDLSAGQVLRELAMIDEAGALSVAFSPDGQHLAVGDSKGRVTLWNAATGQRIGQPLTAGEGWVWSVSFSPDNQMLAAGSEDGSIIRWDLATGQPLGDPLLGHDGGVRSVAFSSDGQTLASGGDDSTVIVWDVASGEPRLDPLEGHTDSVNTVRFSPDGLILASGSDDFTIRLWDAATGRSLLAEPLSGHTDWVLDIEFSPDGQTLASGSADGTIRRWDVSTGTMIGQPITGHGSDVTSLVYSADPDDPFLVSGSDNRTIIMWTVQPGLPTGTLLLSQASGITSIAYHPDGQMLATGSGDGIIRLLDPRTGQSLGDPLSRHTGEIYCVTFSPDGRLLASAGADATIRLWDVTTRQPVGDPLTGPNDAAWRVAFSPDGQSLASGGFDGKIYLWDVATGEQLNEFEPAYPDAGIASVAFSPDGQLLAGSSDDTIMLWDPATYQPVGQPLLGHRNVVNDLAFQPDTPQGQGRLLASGGEDSLIVLWDITTGQQVGEPLVGHDNSIHDVAFSPDGLTLASASFDETVILWDVASGRPFGTPLTGHGAAVDSVAFSPDGQTLASGSQNGNLILWDVNFETWQAIACRRANRNLSLSEWQQLMGDAPYRRTCEELPPNNDQ